jgi:solute carrier family 25 folate transporter 32
MVAAAQAGILTLVMTNPIWVVKTRLCLQYSEMDKTRLPESKRYLGMMDALNKIYCNEGIRGLYKVCVVIMYICQMLHSEPYFSKSLFVIKYFK